VSRGRASEQSVCVYEAISVEKGARCPQLQAAVACQSGGRCRRHLAITATERKRSEYFAPVGPGMPVLEE
jgi:hypothetical protein